MSKSLSIKVISGLLLLGSCAPAVLAEPSNAEKWQRQAINNHLAIQAAQKNNRHRRDHDWDDRHDYRRRDNDWRRRHDDDWRYRNSSSWNHDNWGKHNWYDQRAYLSNNWRIRRNHMSVAQQQQLDQQLRAQWLAYHNNSYDGEYGWNMYNDPGFLDYVHSNKPSLINNIRNLFGF